LIDSLLSEIFSVRSFSPAVIVTGKSNGAKPKPAPNEFPFQLVARLTLGKKPIPTPAKTLGIGNGTFRSKGAIDAGSDDPNVFAGVGIGFLPRVSLATSWNGNSLGAGFGFAPFDFPVTITAGLNDLTENISESKLSINAAYSLSF
jgi:hypothetical protein